MVNNMIKLDVSSRDRRISVGEWFPPKLEIG